MVWLWAHNVGAHASWGARIVWNVADAGFHAVKFRISKQVTLLRTALRYTVTLYNPAST